MATHNFKILHLDKLSVKYGQETNHTKAPERSYFSSPCFFSEFEDDEEAFKKI